MVNAKIVVVGSALAVFATALLSALVILNMNGQNGFYLQATHSEGGVLYLKADSNGINYDFVETKTGASTGTTYQSIDRFVSVAGSTPVLANTVAIDNVVQRVRGAGNEESPLFWHARSVDAAEYQVSITRDGSDYIVTVGGDTRRIVVSETGTVTSFADMAVNVWSTDPSLYESRPTANIPNPTTENTVPAPQPAAAPANLRRHLGYANMGASGCAADSSNRVYSYGGNKGEVTNCNGLNTIGFQGTNPSELNDVWNDIAAVWDNFAGGWRDVEWGSRGTNQNGWYQLCTGHSLGGGIAKFHSSQGRCGEVITFGAPTTVYTQGVPITQFIAVKSSGGCCSRYWWGGCRSHGGYWQDPITLVGAYGGGHTNVLRGGISGIAGGCADGFWSSVWNTGISLHDMAAYQQIAYRCRGDLSC